jgi:hypothetical protein
MTGKILGFEISTGTGTISGDDGKRYKFTKENWKEDGAPVKEVKVDFDITDDGMATDVYQVRDVVVENNETLMGLIAVGITFFFGFIGTFVSRLVLAKQPVGATIVPTAIHFVITLLVLIPVFGWIIYMMGTIYYMVKNYALVIQPAQSSTNKYA